MFIEHTPNPDPGLQKFTLANRVYEIMASGKNFENAFEQAFKESGINESQRGHFKSETGKIITELPQDLTEEEKEQ